MLHAAYHTLNCTACRPVQDLLVASLFRNFLLAERIMRAVSCTPVSLPRLPPSHQHPMWNAWDMAAELCLLQLPAYAPVRTPPCHGHVLHSVGASPALASQSP